MDATLLPIGSVNAGTVKIQPVVLLQICDAYIRRNEKQERVIGTLLGNTSADGVVEVKSCYVVPHNESADQVAVDVVHHKTMYDLHHKVAPTENIVGWFSTGPTISSSDALIQEFYAKELAGTPQPAGPGAGVGAGIGAQATPAPATPAAAAGSTGGAAPATSAAAAAAAPPTSAAAAAAAPPATAAAAAAAPPATAAAASASASAAAAAAASSAPAGPSPVHLTVDTSLTGDRVAVRAYVSRALVLGGRALATEFVPVPSRVVYADLERAGADLLLSGAPSSSKPVAAEHETLQTSVRRLQGLLAIARAYADDVAAGRRKGDPAIGRCLDDALAAAPALPAAEFEALVAQGVQDALLVDHLAHLVRAQIALAERLGTAALPLL